MCLYTDGLVSIKSPRYGENGTGKAVLGSIRSDTMTKSADTKHFRNEV